MPAKRAEELTASHWRMRAERARKVAEHLPNPLVRELMLQIADDYEKLADQRAKKESSSASMQRA